MIVLRSTLVQNTIVNPPLDPSKFMFIDIETTGLSSKYNQIYLIGMSFIDQPTGNWVVEQLFAEDPTQESYILEKFQSILSSNSIISTYNGDSFDIPFIASRMAKYGIVPSQFESHDIYKFLKTNATFFQLQDYKLKAVERALGINRDDIYSGKDCIYFYNKYLRTKSEELLNIILRHNFDDLASMPSLLRLYDIIDQNKTISVMVGMNQTKFKIESVKEAGDLITLKGHTYPPPMSSIKHFLTNSTIEILNDGIFKISYELIKAVGNDSISVSVIDVSTIGIHKSTYDNIGMSVPNGYVLIKAGKNLLVENLKTVVKRHLESMFT